MQREKKRAEKQLDERGLIGLYVTPDPGKFASAPDRSNMDSDIYVEKVSAGKRILTKECISKKVGNRLGIGKSKNPGTHLRMYNVDNIFNN